MFIKRTIAAFFSSILLLGSASAPAADGEITVAVFGDSLTSGYQLQPAEAFNVKLQKKLEDLGFQSVRVVNMSRAEDTSAEGVQRVDQLIVERPDIVVLAYGLNDTMRGIDPVIIYKNVAYMVGRLQQARIYVVLMGIKPPSSLGVEYDNKMNAYFRNIAVHYKVPFYPNALDGIAEKSKYTVADGYRPNAQGVDIMVEGMYRLVDAGVRWAIEVRKYQDAYRRSMQPADAEE